MNDQRKVIFEQRLDIMGEDDVGETVADMRHQVVDELVTQHIPEKAYAEQWDAKGLREEIGGDLRPRSAGRRLGRGRRHRRRRRSTSA